MAGLLWAIIVILAIFWLLGFTVFHLGSIIHLVIVVALVLLVINLLTGRGARV
ncbi:MAG: lmo0937 family membrane protein [Candidatus Eremiobacteraeota bacterium]|nr:lmo0937 family membrane protein [Candidatus Eremiobacteraeota bacterium]